MNRLIWSVLSPTGSFGSLTKFWRSLATGLKRKAAAYPRNQESWLGECGLQDRKEPGGRGGWECSGSDGSEFAMFALDALSLMLPWP